MEHSEHWLIDMLVSTSETRKKHFLLDSQLAELGKWLCWSRACHASVRTSVQDPAPMKIAKCGGVCLWSQNWENGDGMIPRALWTDCSLFGEH